MGKSSMELVVDAVQARLAARDVPYKFGNRYRAEFDAPQRIVWVPRSGTLASPARLAHEHQSRAGLRIRPLYANALRIDAYIYGETLAQVESLWCELLTASREVLGTASEPGDYVIATEDDESGVTAGDYACLIQRFEWSLTLAQASGIKTDPTIWGRTRTVAIASELVYGIDPTT